MQVLLVFSQHERCHSKMIKYHAVGRVLSALKTHQYQGRLQEDGLGVLLNFALKRGFAGRTPA